MPLSPALRRVFALWRPWFQRVLLSRLWSSWFRCSRFLKQFEWFFLKTAWRFRVCSSLRSVQVWALYWILSLLAVFWSAGFSGCSRRFPRENLRFFFEAFTATDLDLVDGRAFLVWAALAGAIESMTAVTAHKNPKPHRFTSFGLGYSVHPFQGTRRHLRGKCFAWAGAGFSFHCTDKH